MKKFLSILLILSGLFANSLDNELKSLTPKQRYVMHYVFYKTKQFNLGYTMTAIAWQESKFGKYPINIHDPSCGIFHIMPKYQTDNRWKQSRMCERLIADKDFSIATALSVFKYWYNYWRSKGYSKKLSWKKAIMSYNGGVKGNKKYYQQIVRKIKALRKVLK